MIYIGILLAVLIMLYYIYWPHKNAFYDLTWKSSSSLCFILLAVFFFFKCPDENYRKLMLVGFVLGGAGDVFLALPFCYPKQKDKFFLLGLVSFLLGHLAFALALYQSANNALMRDCILSVLGGILMILIVQKMGVKFDKMLLPSMIYAMVILFMEMQALQYLFQGMNAYSILLNVGSLAFVLSDLVLVFMLFGDKDTKAMKRLNLTLYYFAQMSLVFTFLVR